MTLNSDSHFQDGIHLIDIFQKTTLNESHRRSAYFSLITVRKCEVNNSMQMT